MLNNRKSGTKRVLSGGKNKAKPVIAGEKINGVNLQKIFDVVSVGMMLIDRDGSVRKINNVAARLSGNKTTQISGGSQPGDILGCVHAMENSEGCGHTEHCSSCPIRNTFESVIKSGKRLHGAEAEATLIIKDDKKSRLWLQINADPLSIDGRKYVVLAINNVTELKRAGEVLRRDKELLENMIKEKTEKLLRANEEINRSKRLSIMGVLSATIAHELRSPLGAIGVAAYNLRKKVDKPDVRKYIDGIDEKINESKQIIDNLLNYTRFKTPQFEKVGLNSVIDECIELISYKHDKDVAIIRELASTGDLTIELDPIQIKEVINNILTNAYDAVSDDTGKIVIKAEKKDDKVKIIIKDNGNGINNENMEKIFEPFFTTKVRGTGLGLPVCRQIINYHSGEIGIESHEGIGTAVNIILPLERMADKSGQDIKALL
jgi:signal transduction histidine kinase